MLSFHDDAMQYCREVFQKHDIKTELVYFSAKENEKVWTQHLFPKWSCKDAKLELIAPEYSILSNYQETELCIIQRSIPIDFRNEPLHFYYIPDNKLNLDYADKLRGAIILIDGHPTSYVDWAKKNKVAGLVSDYFSSYGPINWKNKMADERAFLQFDGLQQTEYGLFGFVITPKLGRKLRELFNHTNNVSPLYTKMLVKGFIDSKFYEETASVLTASIPGKSKQEVVVVAHLCHAKGCANDNASGSAGAMETLIAINDLIKNEELEPPEKTIKAVLVPEIIGTIVFAASNYKQKKEILGAINLDMIGRKQSEQCGLVGLIDVSDANASFLMDLALLIKKEISKDVPTFTGDQRVPYIYVEPIKYMGGSDHYVFCDSSVGVPCLTLMQWMDDAYHSTADTIDKLDPLVLQRCTSLAANFLYILASLKENHLQPIFSETRLRYQLKLHDLIQNQDFQKNHISFGEVISYLKHNHTLAIKDIYRFIPSTKKTDNIIQQELTFFTNLSSLYSNSFLYKSNMTPIDNESEKYYYHIIPKKKFLGPISFIGFFASLNLKQRHSYKKLQTKYPKYFGYSSINEIIIQRVDGKRTIREISQLVALELNIYDIDYVYDYLLFLESIHLINLNKDIQ